MLERLTDDERFAVVACLIQASAAMHRDPASHDERAKLAAIIAKMSGPDKRVVIGPAGRVLLGSKP